MSKAEADLAAADWLTIGSSLVWEYGIIGPQSGVVGLAVRILIRIPVENRRPDDHGHAEQEERGEPYEADYSFFHVSP